MISQEQINELFDAEVVDQHGDRVGSMGEVYVDNRTGEPAWVTVRTGWFSRRVFVPLATAEVTNGQIRVPYPTARIKDAPAIEVDGHLSENDEANLYRYYAVEEGPAPSA